jgi:hypothetical protein
MKISGWVIGLSLGAAFIAVCVIYEAFINKNFDFGRSEFTRTYQNCGAQVTMHAGNISSACSQ